MKAEEKQKLYNFLSLTRDTLTSGYKIDQSNPVFKDDDIEQEPIPSSPLRAAGQSCRTDGPCEALLTKLSEEIRACKQCALHQKRLNTVPGEGVKNPLVMVIGEGPGQEEDEQGRPFVGKAGQLLDKMLASIDLSRTTNCYIANAVKCRPPGNRNPLPEETAACAYFLNKQIELLKPEFILVLGGVAAGTLLKTSESVTKLRGKITQFSAGSRIIPLLVTFHPAALLRDVEKKRPAWEDLKLLRGEIEKKEK